jgi:hypothetical protein
LLSFDRYHTLTNASAFPESSILLNRQTWNIRFQRYYRHLRTLRRIFFGNHAFWAWTPKKPSSSPGRQTTFCPVKPTDPCAICATLNCRVRQAQRRRTTHSQVQRCVRAALDAPYGRLKIGAARDPPKSTVDGALDGSLGIGQKHKACRPKNRTSIVLFWQSNVQRNCKIEQIECKSVH